MQLARIVVAPPSIADVVGDSEGAEREHARASLRDQLARLDALKASLAKLEASAAPPDPKTVLEWLERRVMALRATLNLGGIEALPAVAEIMGKDKFVASRIDNNGRVTEWKLTSRISTAYLFARIDDQGKARIKGAPATPATAGTATAPPIAPVTPATAPAGSPHSR